MKGGATAALALGVGYILGRRRKMRLATMMAIGAATGGAARLGPAAMRQGTKYLSKTDIAGALGPQVTEIVNTVRGELLDAAKVAATAAVTNRIDTLSDSLHERAETLKNPEAAVGKVGETAGETAGRAGETVGRAGGKLRRRGREADIEDETEPEPERDAEERGNAGGRRQRSRASRDAQSESDEYEEPEDEYEGEEEPDEEPADEADELEEDETEEPTPRRRRTTRSPVTRTRG